MSVQFKPLIPELEQASPFYGSYSRVARRLGVSPQHVRQVAKGQRTSRRVLTELRREIRRIRGKQQRNAA